MDEIIQVEQFLKANNIKYELLRHQAVFTCEQSKQTIVVDDCAACKNLFVKDKYSNRFYLVVLLSDKVANMRSLAYYVGTRKFEFGSEDKLKEVLNLTSGSVSPFGLLNDKYHLIGKVIIDKEIFDYKFVKFHPNNNSATVVIDSGDLTKMLELLHYSFVNIDTAQTKQL